MPVETPEKNPVGRQPIHDKVALADHLNEWSKDYRNWDLCKWVDEVDIDPRLPTKWAKEYEYFGEAWRRAKNRIAGRRTEMTLIEEMPWGLYNKYQHNYDVMHHDFEEEIKDKDAHRQAKAKADVENSVNPDTVKQFMDVMNQLSKIQSKSDLKSADSNIKSEQ